MPKSRLEIDIINYTDERLGHWYNDTVQRCEIAKLGNAQTAAMIVSCLVSLIVYIFQRMDMSENDFLSVMRFHYRDAKQKTSAEKPRT